LKIAVVTETFYPFVSGSGRRYLEIFRRLAERGFDVDLYTVRLKKEWPKSEVVEGIKVHRYAIPSRGYVTSDGFRSITDVSVYSFGTLLRLLRNKNHDVYEVNHCPIFPPALAWLVARSRSRPLSLTVHEVWHSYWYHYVPRKIYAPVGIAFEKFISRLPDAIIAVSETTGHRLSALLSSSKPIYVIPNGVNLEAFNGVSVERDPMKILYAGRLNPHKRVDLLLLAYRELQEHCKEISLEIVGSGPELHNLKRLAKDLGLNNVSFRGCVDDLGFIRSLKSAGVFVLPSLREGQSIVFFEAMAAGTPAIIVRSECNAASDFVNNDHNGLLVHPHPDNIASAIDRLLSSNGLWKRIQRNGLEFAKKFTWDRSAERHLKLYEFLSSG